MGFPPEDKRVKTFEKTFYPLLIVFYFPPKLAPQYFFYYDFS